MTDKDKNELRKILAELVRGKVIPINQEEVYIEKDIDQALTQINALYLAEFERMLPQIDDWQCDNVNCGKGAICNFCALRQMLAEIRFKINENKPN